MKFVFLLILLVFAALSMEKNVGMYGRTPVWIAAWRGRLDEVKFLAAKNVDLNQADDYGQTPVWVAARFGHTEIVKFLIEKNVNLEEKLLKIAKTEEIKWLIAHELNKIQTDFWNGLQEGRVDVVASLADKFDLNKAGHAGLTPVFVAAWWGRTELVKFLATKGVDLNRPDIVGQTPIFVAAAEGRTEVVRFLATNNVDLNRANDRGHTPIHVAAMNGHTKIVRILIENNVKLDENLLWNLSSIKSTVEIKRLIVDALEK